MNKPKFCRQTSKVVLAVTSKDKGTPSLSPGCLFFLEISQVAISGVLDPKSDLIQDPTVLELMIKS
jgi:hypothetical protein